MLVSFSFLLSWNNRHCFPPLPKLETLNLSYSETLQTIDDGAFQNLSALQHFSCRNNHQLKTIHPNAFAKSKNGSQTEWPPIRNVSVMEMVFDVF